MPGGKNSVVYGAATPAFLQRLRGQVPTGPTGQSSQDRAGRRIPDRLSVNNTEENDDDPTYVDSQTGEILSAADVHALANPAPTDEQTTPPDLAKSTTTPVPAGSVHATAAIGGRTKRKTRRIVADADKNDTTSHTTTTIGDIVSTRADPSPRPAKRAIGQPTVSADSVKKRKKRQTGKPVKLSFDEDEGTE